MPHLELEELYCSAYLQLQQEGLHDAGSADVAEQTWPLASGLGLPGPHPLLAACPEPKITQICCNLLPLLGQSLLLLCNKIQILS